MSQMLVTMTRARRNRKGHDAEAGSVARALRWVVALGLTGIGIATASAQPALSSNLSGTWTLQESTGDLPDEAVRAVDGRPAPGVPAAIRIEQTAASVTVRRLGTDATVLRLMVVDTSAGEETSRAGLLKAQAEWREGTLVARGEVTVKRGLLKRRVAFEERWQLDETRSRLTVTMTLRTPLGTRHRTQAFLRASDEAHLFAHDVIRSSQ